MKLFLVKTAFMVFLLGVTAWLCWIINDLNKDTSTNGWACIIDKHQHAKTTSKMTWLIGGSNVMFGYDSDLLSDSLHTPVLNMGIGAALGLPFILNEASAVAKPNDIIIMSLEYNLREGNYDSQLCAADFYPPARHYISYPNPMVWLRAHAHYQLKKARTGLNTILYGNGNGIPPTVADTINVYFRKAFSRRGDLVSHMNNPPPAQINFDQKQVYTPYSSYIALLNRFIDRMRRREGTLHLSTNCTNVISGQ